MSFTLRVATPEDIPMVSEWTQDTFSWGDYVPKRMPTWLEDENSRVVVCVVDARPVAVAHAVMLSPREAWLEAARVHPDHKRTGMGKAMNRAGVDWARERGAVVVRLAAEADNEASVSQVEAIGYRRTSSWVFGRFNTDMKAGAVDDRHRFKPATGQDADAAWMSWSAGELSYVGRELIAFGWQWRKARPGDLHDAVASGQLYQSADGWVFARTPESDRITVDWLATTRENAPGLMKGLNALARSRGIEEVGLKVPNCAWLSEAMIRVGAEVSEVLVFSLSL